MDAQLDCDDRTMVQPDVILLCNREKLRQRCIYGAPDFLIEILSESSASKDMYLKLMKYQNAGVREYWMVDPKRKKIIVHMLENSEIPVIYGFEDEIPVGVLKNDCVIDFKEICEYVRFVMEKEA